MKNKPRNKLGMKKERTTGPGQIRIEGDVPSALLEAATAYGVSPTTLANEILRKALKPLKERNFTINYRVVDFVIDIPDQL